FPLTGPSGKQSDRVSNGIQNRCSSIACFDTPKLVFDHISLVREVACQGQLAYQRKEPLLGRLSRSESGRASPEAAECDRARVLRFGHIAPRPSAKEAWIQTLRRDGRIVRFLRPR